MAYYPYQTGPSTGPIYPNSTMPGAYSPASQAIPQVNSAYSSIIPVNGKEGVDNYPVAPGNTLVFMDTSTGLLYVKYRDAYGNIPVINVYQKQETKEEIKMDQISRSDFDSLSKEVKELRDILDSLTK